jgi:Ca2+-transporting ATPase
MINRDIPLNDIGELLSHARGLDEAEVAARRTRFGPNDILIRGPAPWRLLLQDTARDPMIWFLVGMGALYALIGAYRDTLVLLLALLPLLGMDAYLHRRTMASTQGLAQRLAAGCTVERAGRRQNIAARDLVPGDLVHLAPGDLVPADAIVLAGAEIQIDESSLTGESASIRKTIWATAREGDFWVFAGTRLLAGTARIRIAHTGAHTLYGEIARSAKISSHASTPLQAAIGRLVGILLVIAIAICLALAAIRYWQGYGLLDAVMSALTLAIAALPEEFPVVFTFYLGVGVYRLAQRQALVRRAVAVENIGRVSCICSDKTGTLTEGRLELAHCEAVTGIAPVQLVAMAAQVADPASSDPLDVALRNWLQREGTAPDALPRIAGYPFTEARRRESAILRKADAALLAVVKGAPETVLAMCGEADAVKADWLQKVSAYAAGGHKVIACAARIMAENAWDGSEPESGYAFAGLLACEDRLREGVRPAVDSCRAAGIRIVVVTGDHPLTALAIGREIGLRDGKPVVALADEVIDGDGDAGKLHGIDVIARAAPAQKLTLVKALQRAGEIVAVTGDGINDVPALQAADIGIAMGERGTQSAREIAAIVLLDDNFRTIVRAIAEGRQLFANLATSFAYLLMVHIAFVATAAVIPFLGYPLLYLPLHIVWLELIIHPTAMLVFQAAAPRDATAPPRSQGVARFFTARDGWVIALTGGALAVLVTGAFIFALAQQWEVAAARSLTLVVLISAGATLTLALGHPVSRAGYVVTGASLASVILMAQVPALADWAHLLPLQASDLALAMLAGGGCGALALLRRRSPSR